MLVVSYLALQACISLCSVSDKSGALLFSLGGSQEGGFGGCSPVPKTGTRVHPDVPRYHKPERGYIRMFPGRHQKPERRYIGMFPAESPVPKTGTRAHSPKPPFYETALLFFLSICLVHMQKSLLIWLRLLPFPSPDGQPAW